MTLPTVPPTPTDPTPEAIAQWERDMRYWESLATVERIAAMNRQATSQEQTAAAMRDAAQAKFAQSRQELVLFFCERNPQRSTETINAYFDEMAKMAAQFLGEHGKP